MAHMVRLCLIGQHIAGDKRHAQAVMDDLKIKYLYAVPHGRHIK